MDYEKKYKNALEWARQVMNGKIGFVRDEVQEIFPELVESEDEKIRKTLIEYFNAYPKDYYGELKKSHILAWLEKQESIGEIVERCKDSWYNEGKIAGMAEGLTDDEKYQQGWHDALEKHHTDPYNGVGFDCYGHHWSMCARDNGVELWVDNKLVQHFGADIHFFEGKSVLEAINEVKVDNSNSVYGVPFDYEHATITQKDFATKQEPKFHEDDWVASNICNSSDLLHIIDVDDKNYEVETPQGNTGVPSIAYIDNNFHLWAIEDARNGNVLYSSEHNLLWIYKNKVEYHASINLNYAYYVSYNNNIVIPSDARPATKEQCDFLFSKIEETGFEWDAEEKKVL